MLRVITVILAAFTAVQSAGPTAACSSWRTQSLHERPHTSEGLLPTRPETTSDRSTAVPSSVMALCSLQGSLRFVGGAGDSQVFRGPAESVKRCDGGRIWAAKENGAVVPDAATFYFSDRGALLDVCQPLSWPSGCHRFAQLTCDTANVCE